MSPSATVPTSAALIGRTGRSFHESQRQRVCPSAEQRNNWDRQPVARAHTFESPNPGERMNFQGAADAKANRLDAAIVPTFGPGGLTLNTCLVQPRNPELPG